MKQMLKTIYLKLDPITNAKRFVKTIFISSFRLSKPNWWSCIIAEELSRISLKIGQYQYNTSSELLLWRAKTLHTKEPITIDWLTNFKEDEILFDVGANVGMYSIFAGVNKVKVYSFEPEASNYSILNQNIYSNNISKYVKAYPLAISDLESFDVLKITSMLSGSGHTTFGNNDKFKQVKNPTVFEQGSFCTTLDNLVYKYKFPIPNYLKIDVDGLESKIIKGANNLIKANQIKSILIELNENLEEDQWVISFLTENGYKLVKKANPVISNNNSKLSEYIFNLVSG